MSCKDGMCWAESLKEACDYWQRETERLRRTPALQAADESLRILTAQLDQAEELVDRLAVENDLLRRGLEEIHRLANDGEYVGYVREDISQIAKALL